MSRPKSEQPTKGEVAILTVLWEHGGCTIRQIQRHLRQGSAPSSILTRLTIMRDKGLVREDTDEYPKHFHAAITSEQVQRHAVRDLVQKLFGGSRRRLAMHLISRKKASPEELKQIDRLFDDLD